MLDIRCWILDVGCWMLDARCWMLDARCEMRDTCYEISLFRFSLLATRFLSFKDVVRQVEEAEDGG